MDTGENSSGDEFEDASELLNDDDDFLAMMDVPATKKPQTLSKKLLGMFYHYLWDRRAMSFVLNSYRKAYKCYFCIFSLSTFIFSSLCYNFLCCD